MDEERRRLARAAAALKRVDAEPRLVKAARTLRGILPGDREYGDPLSVAGSEPSQLLGQRLTAATSVRPSALREFGLGALQVWQSMSEAQGRGRGDHELAIVFTDLVDFSSWALEAGDEPAVELLRRVGQVVEPLIEERGGRVVKRLGDGLMAVFEEPAAAVGAALAALGSLGAIQVDGYSPRMRAGVHVGRPRRLGGDYLGVDVNIAARVASAADAGEVLISERVCQQLGERDLRLRRRLRFKAKGAPSDLKVYAARAA